MAIIPKDTAAQTVQSTVHTVQLAIAVMFDDSSSEYSYLAETEQALLDLQRQLQPWLAQQAQRSSGGGATRVRASPGRQQASVRRDRKLLDKLPRHMRLNQRTSTLGITLEELDDMGLLDGGSIPPYFRSIDRRDRREMDMRRRSARRKARAHERMPHAVVTVNHMLRVLERRGVNVVAHFRAYDQQARGILPRQKFAHALQTLGLPLSSSDVGRLIADFAADEAHKHVSCFALLVDANILPSSRVGQEAYMETPPTPLHRQQFELQTDHDASEESAHTHSWTSASEVTMLVQEVRAVTLQVAHALRKSAADVYELFAVSSDVDGYMPATQFFRVLARLHVILSEDQQALLVELFGDETQKRVQFEDFVRYVFDTGNASSQDEMEDYTASYTAQSPTSSTSFKVSQANSHRRPLSAVAGPPHAKDHARPTLRPLTASARVNQSGWTSDERRTSQRNSSPEHRRVGSGDLLDDFIYEEPSDDGFEDGDERINGRTASEELGRGEPPSGFPFPFPLPADQASSSCEPEHGHDTTPELTTAPATNNVDMIRQRRTTIQSARAPVRRNQTAKQSPSQGNSKQKRIRPHSAGACVAPKFSLSGTVTGKLSAQTTSSYGSFAYIPTLQTQTTPQEVTLQSGATDHDTTDDFASDSQRSKGQLAVSEGFSSTLQQLRQLIQQRHSPDRPLRWIFRHFDRKKRNYFDKSDLAESLHDLKLDHSKACVDYIMKAVAIDDGEQVSLGEFVVFVTDPGHRELADIVFSTLASQLESQGRGFYGGLFGVLAAGTGSDSQQNRPNSAAPAATSSSHQNRRAVSRDEFVSGLLSLCKQLTVTDAERIATRYDLHGSGYVSLGRFWKSLSNSPQWKAAEELLSLNEEALEQSEIVKDRLRVGESMPDMTAEIVDMAVQLGVRLLAERHLLWIVKKALEADLPEDWIAKTDKHGRLYYFNRVTGELAWRHPLREMFLKLVCQHRAEFAQARTKQLDLHEESSTAPEDL